MQILHVVQRMGEYTPVECFFAGKDSFKKGMPKLTAQIVIGTPGTMIDVRRAVPSFFSRFNYCFTSSRKLIEFPSDAQMVTKARVLDLKEVKVFVLDEADNMLESGSMGDQSIQLKKCVFPLPSIRTFLFILN